MDRQVPLLLVIRQTGETFREVALAVTLSNFGEQALSEILVRCRCPGVKQPIMEAR